MIVDKDLEGVKITSYAMGELHGDVHEMKATLDNDITWGEKITILRRLHKRMEHILYNHARIRNEPGSDRGKIEREVRCGDIKITIGGE